MGRVTAMDQTSESLGVDDSDSDLASFLPPHPRPFPPFAPCSSRSAASRSPTPEPTPVSADQNPDGKRRRHDRKIPGPAGSVQLAMMRWSEKGFDLDEGVRGLGTQEYLRRAVECGDDQEDFDFGEDAGGGAWVRAVDFVRERGLVEGDGISIGTPLCNLKKGVAQDKVPQVVALIKSCSPNGLGDLFVTLKDPTGTIGASIHRKVLLDKGFGKDIAVGAALILQKVAVFSPVRSSCCLNITLNNIVQVISKDGKLLSMRKEPTQAVDDSSNSDSIVDSGNLAVVDVESSQAGERIRGSMMSSSIERENEAEHDFRQTLSQQSKATQGSQAAIFSEQWTMNPPDASAPGEGPLSKSTDMASHVGITRANFKSSDDNGQGAFASLQAKLFSGGAMSTSENRECICTGSQVKANDGKENQRRTSVQRTSVPEWTEEQLDELLEFD